jgi:hypothetical protein
MGWFLMAALGVLTANARLKTTVKKLDIWSATNAGNSGGKSLSIRSWLRRVSWWKSVPLNYADNGRIEGVITTNTAPTPLSRVSLYYAPSGVLIAREVTNALGEYDFGKNSNLPVALDPLDTAMYYVVAEDPTNARNAKITDRITPSA